MILQALCGYYRRSQATSGETAIPLGYAMAGARTLIVLNESGDVVNAQSLLERQGKKLVARRLLVPQPPKRTGQKPEPAFLYETVAFLFGIYDKPEGARYRFDASARIHREILGGVDDPGAKALLAFFDKRTLGSVRYDDDDASPLDDPNAFVVFALAGESIFLHERPAIRAAWDRYLAAQSAEREIVQCLVTGERAPLARLHGNVSGFGMNKPTLVGFNQPAFEFFGKSQGENAPVGERAAFEYATALNMLCTDRRHYINLAGDKVVFWAERDAQLEEDVIFAVLGGTVEREYPEETLDANLRERIRGLLECYMREGDPVVYSINPDVTFYVLGLAANRTRLVVRFFYASTFGHLMENLAAHYHDIEVGDMRYRFPSPRRLLMEAALKDGAGLARMDSVPPTIESALMRAILERTGYPAALYAAVLERVRAEGAVTPLRAGLIKGYLIRNEKEEGVGMGLDPNERDPAYLMGRLFALYEKAQVEAIESLNASITDKYLNAAMATPRTVFPTLMQLNQKHISKTHNYYLSGKISDVWNMLAIQSFESEKRARNADDAKSVFPATMNANAQGKFILGYYHENKDLYTKKEAKKPEDEEKGGESNE